MYGRTPFISTSPLEGAHADLVASQHPAFWRMYSKYCKTALPSGAANAPLIRLLSVAGALLQIEQEAKRPLFARTLSRKQQRRELSKANRRLLVANERAAYLANGGSLENFLSLWLNSNEDPGLRLSGTSGEFVGHVANVAG